MRSERNVDEVVKTHWKQLLRVSAANLEDRFFALGGHSLTAIRLIRSIESDLTISIPLKNLFNDDRLGSLIASVKARLPQDHSGTLPIARSIDRGPAWISLEQQRIWLIAQDPSTGDAYSVHVDLDCLSHVDTALMTKAVHELVSRHEPLRTRFEDLHGRGIQTVLPPNMTCTSHVPSSYSPFVVADHDVSTNESQGAELNLEEGVLFQVRFFQNKGGDKTLRLTFHHIVVDKRALSVLVRELGLIYNCLVNGVAANLPELNVEYYDYCRWQHNIRANEDHKSQLAFWKAYLLGGSFALPAYVYDSTLPKPSPQSKRITFVFGEPLMERLSTFVAGIAAPRFTRSNVVGAAIQLALHEVLELSDVCVGVPFSTREQSAQLRDMVGFFLNTLPIRTKTGPGVTLIGFISAYQQALVSAMTNGYVPLDEIVAVSLQQEEGGTNLSPRIIVSMDELRDEANGPRNNLFVINNDSVNIKNASLKTDIHIGIEIADREAIGFIDYDASLIRGNITLAIKESFVRWITNFVESPNQTVDLSERPRKGVASVTIQPRTATGPNLRLSKRHWSQEDGLRDTLAEIWAACLPGSAAVDNPNLFHVGGSSLTCQRLASEIYRKCGLRVSIREIFTHPHFDELNEILHSKHSQRANSPNASAPSNVAAARALRPSNAQLWMLEDLRNQPDVFAQSVISRRFILRGALDTKILERAINIVSSSNSSLHTQFLLLHDEITPVYAEPSVFAFGAEREPPRSRATSGRFNRFRVDDKPIEIDVRTQNPFFATVAKSGPQTFVFTLQVHHIAADGASVNDLIDAISSIYNSLVNKESISYIGYDYFDYVATELKEVSSLIDEDDRLKLYWSQYLRCLSCDPYYEISPNRPAKFSSALGIYEYTFPQNVALALIRTSCEQNTSIYVVLLAAMFKALEALTGLQETYIRSPVSVRPHYGEKHKVGMFTHMIVLRASSLGPVQLSQLIQQLHIDVANALQHKRVAPTYVTSLIEGSKRDSYITKFPFQLNYLEQKSPTNLTLSGIASTPWYFRDVDRKARCDLGMTIQRTANAFSLEIRYYSDCFSAESINIFLKHLITYLSYD